MEEMFVTVRSTFVSENVFLGWNLKEGRRKSLELSKREERWRFLFAFGQKKSRKLAAGKKLFMAPDFFGSTLRHLMCYYARSKYGPLYKKGAQFNFVGMINIFFFEAGCPFSHQTSFLSSETGNFLCPPLFGARTVICDFILSNIAPKEEEEGPLPPPSDGGASRVLPG